MNDREIQWHLPYIAAMNLEMEKDRERFVFVPEYVLNTGAIKIDLFIENMEDSPASNEIGKILSQESWAGRSTDGFVHCLGNLGNRI